MLLKEQTFDLVVSMYDLPDMKGIDLVQTAQANGCDAPFIFYDRRKGTNNVPDEGTAPLEDTGDTPGPDQRSGRIETLFKTIAERTAIAILLHRNGNVIYANHAAEELTGYGKKELQLVDPITLVHPDEREKLQARVRQCPEETRQADRFRLRMVQKDGQECPVEITTETCTTPEKQIVIVTSILGLRTAEGTSGSLASAVSNIHVMNGAERNIKTISPSQKIDCKDADSGWSFSDISGEKETENAVLEREHFFTTLLNAIRDGVLILSKNGIVRYANSAAGELVGLPCAGDCVGRNILEFVHQDSIHAFFRDLLSIRGGSDAIPAEYALITPSGGVRQVESLSSSILWNEEKAIAITLRDITERKQAEAAAQESADLNRALIDGLPEYIFVLTGEGNVIFTNPAAEAALGCTPGAVKGKSMRSFIQECSLQDFDTAVQEAFAGQKPRSFEIGIKTVTDEVLQVTLRAAQITFKNQDAVLLLLTDLTERLVLEKELEYHARELKRFSEALTRTNEKLTIMNSITRHDILNQLTALLGYLEIAAEESREPETLESLNKMKSAAQNIREQLEFARDYQDLGVREPQWFDVRWQVARLRHDDITIETTIQKIEVFADPLFERVFYNLLDNAVRHGTSVTKIRVTARKDDDTLTIIWEDNGTGVREEEKEKIFKRGYGSNTGLGLFLCREILAITGMMISECGEYGKGARFEIRVPPGGYREEE